MTANLKKTVLYGLAISLVIILAGTITGCKTSAPSTPSASTGSSKTSTATSAQQRQGTNGTTSTPSPSSPAATASPVTPSPTSSPGAQPTPAVSTSIPVISPTPLSASAGGAPVILITAPLNVSTVPAGDVTLSDIVSNFNLVDKIGQASVSGEGHIIYYMDVTPPTIQYQSATTAAGTYAESTATSYTWHNVRAGFHYFSVQLVNNDSTPLIPAITVTVYVTVQGITQSNPSPSSTITPVPAS